jgi:hypothetical protein
MEYTWLTGGSQITGPSLLACEGCGAVIVRDRLRAHDRHHEALARAASEAHRADSMMRPLGGGKPPGGDAGTWCGEPIG